MGITMTKKKNIFNEILNINEDKTNTLINFVINNKREQIYEFIMSNKLYDFNYKYPYVLNIYNKLYYEKGLFRKKGYDYHSIILPNTNIAIYENNSEGVLEYESSTNSIFNGVMFDSELKNNEQIIVRQMNYYLEKDDKIDFILENIIHIILYNYYNKFITQLKLKINVKEKIIPPIYYLGTSKFNNTTGNLITIMPYIGKSLFDVIFENKISRYNLYDLFFQICFHIRILQLSCKFMHRDLHAGNILVHKRENQEIISYNFNNKNIKIISDYKIYFIDFGQSCIDLSICNNCEIKNKIFTKTSSYNFDKNKEDILITCENNSHDLRTLFSSIYNNIKHNKKLSELVLYFRDSIIVKKEWEDIYRELNVYDPLFDPENIINLLFKIFRL